MSAITTHVLDAARGLPARGVGVVLERDGGGGAWARLGAGVTDADGRLAALLPPAHTLLPGLYRLTFETGAYFAATGTPTFYPRVEITFGVADAGRHYHVPLLLSPFAYSTYRGS